MPARRPGLPLPPRPVPDPAPAGGRAPSAALLLDVQRAGGGRRAAGDGQARRTAGAAPTGCATVQPGSQCSRCCRRRACSRRARWTATSCCWPAAAASRRCSPSCARCWRRARAASTLIYANRDERSVIFRRELKALAGAHPARLMVIHWLDSVQGVPSVANWPNWRAFPQGPGLHLRPRPLHGRLHVRRCRASRWTRAQIHVERFASLPDEDRGRSRHGCHCDRRRPPPRRGGRSRGRDACTRARHRITCGGNESLLEAALRVRLQRRIPARRACARPACAR
jgi:hypothetical protein